MIASTIIIIIAVIPLQVVLPIWIPFWLKSGVLLVQLYNPCRPKLTTCTKFSQLVFLLHRDSHMLNEVTDKLVEVVLDVVDMEPLVLLAQHLPLFLEKLWDKLRQLLLVVVTLKVQK